MRYKSSKAIVAAVLQTENCSPSTDDQCPSTDVAPSLSTAALLNYDDVQIDLDDRLGRGSFSMVYKGMWNDRIVAVKQLHLQQLSPSDEKCFLQEIRIMSIIVDHPHLVSLIGYTLQPACLILEYVPLGSLGHLIHHSKKLTDGQLKKRITLGIVLGMVQLHLLRIVHGDLKPANILITNDYTAKVTDFGFATLRDKSSSAMSSSDNERAIRGTACYMAPELLDSGHPPSSRTDVYSFGVMLNEIIQGEEPYVGELSNFAGRGPFGAVNYAKLGHRPRIDRRTATFLKHYVQKCWRAQAKARPSFDQIYKDLNWAHVKLPNTFDVKD